MDTGPPGPRHAVGDMRPLRAREAANPWKSGEPPGRAACTGWPRCRSQGHFRRVGWPRWHHDRDFYLFTEFARPAG
jgi:hypothetical protein